MDRAKVAEYIEYAAVAGTLLTQLAIAAKQILASTTQQVQPTDPAPSPVPKEGEKVDF